MNAEQFTYWLQGYAELTTDTPSAEQWQSIKDHLALVFKKVTPPLGGLQSLYPSSQVMAPPAYSGQVIC